MKQRKTTKGNQEPGKCVSGPVSELGCTDENETGGSDVLENTGIMDADKEERLNVAMREAGRFLDFAKIALRRHRRPGAGGMLSTREMGQVRRSSMDLSQALVRLRRFR